MKNHELCYQASWILADVVRQTEDSPINGEVQEIFFNLLKVTEDLREIDL